MRSREDNWLSRRIDVLSHILIACCFVGAVNYCSQALNSAVTKARCTADKLSHRKDGGCPTSQNPESNGV